MRSGATEIKKKEEENKGKEEGKGGGEERRQRDRSVGRLGVKAVVNSFTRSYSFIASFTPRFLSGFVVFGNESLLHAADHPCGREAEMSLTRGEIAK